MREIQFFIISALDNATIGILTLKDENAIDYLNANEDEKRNMRLDMCLVASKHFNQDCFVCGIKPDNQ